MEDFNKITLYLWGLITAFAGVIAGYFSGIESILILLLIAFAADSTLGFFAAKMVDGEKFDHKKLWFDTMIRVIIVIVSLLLAFAWDQVYGMESYPSHKGVGWFVTGALLANFIKNAWKLTKWEIFEDLGEFLGGFRKKNNPINKS